MFKKFVLFLAFLSILLISSLSLANGQIERDSSKMEHDPSNDLSKLLKHEDKSEFFSNHDSGDFQTIFLRDAIQYPSNNILIKSGTYVTLTGSFERAYCSKISYTGKVFKVFSNI